VLEDAVAKISAYQNFQYKARALKTPALEVGKNPNPGRAYEIRIEAPEFTCLCPKTGQPDFAVIRLEYVPSSRIVELKSFKLYLQAFRNQGIFHESVANRVLDDFLAACRPRRARVIADFNVRGGIHTVVEAGFKW
jgi:7-cyano-7-deazaguanine reductase